MARRVFVLDTNVLMHDPAALFRFEEHDIFLPMVVLEELDAGKKGLSEVARNVRQVSRFLDELMQGCSHADIEAGIPLSPLTRSGENGDTPVAWGRLYFETHNPSAELPTVLPGSKADNSILLSALSLRAEQREREVVLVSKDINLRIKAAVIGIDAEDYYNDKVLEDLDLLYTGAATLPPDFWEQHGDSLDSWQEGARTFYRVTGEDTREWISNQCLHFDAENDVELIVRDRDQDGATLALADDYREGRKAVWGVNARNSEQNFALNLLMDPDIDIVTLLGAAGTGKTLLALAAGLAQTMDEQRYREIVMTRVTVPVGDDIGFLPGTEEEKMTPWMGALMDNLEVLTGNQEGSDWERAATNELLAKRIKIRSVNFMRGRTFLHRYIILDEAQNLTPKQMKTLITRAGPGSKIVCLGNLAQIDTPYLTETTSGLTNVVDRFRGWEHAGHITLARGERSRLADYASQAL
ncbi:PhoH family protein [Spectribacter hydrogenooxidans]|uniref:PhoH family protein n=1 Tax=Spectribacter hydrogenoxidans TaxID=3075608 RepID=A0ABU3C1J9_9GAMM|nr:PhoH family protein [Salinisphaera sp. W335]MDT0635432.1 PhoH family protein [Salinisphaera sp. W335]